MARRGACAALLVWMAAAGGIGCGRVERAEQCHRLVTTVNPVLDAIEARHRQDGAQPEALQRMAARYDRLAVDLRRLSFEDAKLQRLVVEYAQVFGRTAHLLRELAQSTKRRNPARAARLRGDLDGEVRREKALTQRIHHACHAP